MRRLCLVYTSSIASKVRIRNQSLSFPHTKPAPRYRHRTVTSIPSEYRLPKRTGAPFRTPVLFAVGLQIFQEQLVRCVNHSAADYVNGFIYSTLLQFLAPAQPHNQIRPRRTHRKADPVTVIDEFPGIIRCGKRLPFHSFLIPL